MATLDRLIERAVTTNEPDYWAVLFDHLEESGALRPGGEGVAPLLEELMAQGRGDIDQQKWQNFFRAYAAIYGHDNGDLVRSFFELLGRSKYECAVDLHMSSVWRHWRARHSLAASSTAEVDGMNRGRCGEHWVRDLEREKMEWLVGENGNFETKPLKCQVLETGSEEEIAERLRNPTLWALTEHLWMEFAPEWLQRELEREHPDAQFLTVYGGQSSYPFLLIEGEVWERVYDGAHTPEVECPNTNFDSDHDDVPDRRVSLTDTYCGEYPGERCRYCEADLGEEHGVIYMGEGAEAVYAHTPEEDD